MPTGYTAGVLDGEVTDLREFLLIASRGLGFSIMNRDAPLDADHPPQESTPSTSYADRALKEANEQLPKLRAMSAAEADAAALADYHKRLTYWREAKAKREISGARYEYMNAQVLAWQPTTEAGEAVKKFALDQLAVGYEGDVRVSERHSAEPTANTGETWREEQIARYERDLEYHDKARREEIERTDDRNRWVREFFADLPPAQPAEGGSA